MSQGLPAQGTHPHSTADSPLLQCLAHLKDDVWDCILLLPKLIKDGSAASITCELQPPSVLMPRGVSRHHGQPV